MRTILIFPYCGSPTIRHLDVDLWNMSQHPSQLQFSSRSTCVVTLPRDKDDRSRPSIRVWKHMISFLDDIVEFKMSLITVAGFVRWWQCAGSSHLLFSYELWMSIVWQSMDKCRDRSNFTERNLSKVSIVKRQIEFQG